MIRDDSVVQGKQIIDQDKVNQASTITGQAIQLSQRKSSYKNASYDKVSNQATYHTYHKVKHHTAR